MSWTRLKASLFHRKGIIKNFNGCFYEAFKKIFKADWESCKNIAFTDGLKAYGCNYISKVYTLHLKCPPFISIVKVRVKKTLNQV